MALSNEQMGELQQIQSIDNPEERNKKLQEFITKLSPEQLEDLKRMQAPQCPFCLISEGKLDSAIIHKDDNVMAVMDIKPAGDMHIIVFPRKHTTVIQQTDEIVIKDVFGVVKKVIDSLSKLGFNSTNILVYNGLEAEQTSPHFLVNIVTRKNGDSIDLSLPRGEAKLEDLKAVAASIKANLPQEKPKEQKKEYWTMNEKIP